ncbi:DoxX family protein [Patescibacteria group bacterium]|nr:MAG: DoxX family protein [Patescibacteria group bacterium]
MKNFAAKIYNPNVGLLLIRIALGIVFIYHGLGKFENMEDTIKFFSLLDLPVFFAYLVATVEFFGGLFLLLGLFVEISAAILAVVMFMAIVLAKYANGFAGMTGRPGYELDLVLFLVLLGVACLGPGRFALKKFWVKDVSSLG